LIWSVVGIRLLLLQVRISPDFQFLPHEDV
jgi:hypothetical protein